MGDNTPQLPPVCVICNEDKAEDDEYVELKAKCTDINLILRSTCYSCCVV